MTENPNFNKILSEALNTYLKPCPLCGTNAKVWHSNYETFIQCENWSLKDGERHLVQVSDRNEEDAIKKWNNRKGEQ